MSLERQRTFLSEEQLDKVGYVIIAGCGSIGGEVADTLTRMGVKRFVLADDGEVEDVNIGPQPFSAGEIGNYKVHCLDQRMKRYSPWAEVRDFDPIDDEGPPLPPGAVRPAPVPVPLALFIPDITLPRVLIFLGRFDERWLRHIPDWDRSVPYVSGARVLILAVDSMEARKKILGACVGAERQNPIDLVIDTRMGMQELWMEVAVGQEQQKEMLGRMPEDKATVQEPCTERTISYTPKIAAGYVGRTIAAFCRAEDVPVEIHVDLKAFNQWTRWSDGSVRAA